MASPACPLTPTLDHMLNKDLLPPAPPAPLAADDNTSVSDGKNGSLGAQSPAQLCAVSHSPSKGELWWMNRADENATTPSVRNLKGALLPKQKEKISSRHWVRKATRIDSIHQWSQRFSIDFLFRRKSFPFRNSLEITTSTLRFTFHRRPTSAFYKKPLEKPILEWC